MIKKVPFEIDTKNMAAKDVALILGKEDSILNGITGKISGQRKDVSGKDFRLVHDGVKVIGLIPGAGITYTLDRVVEFATEELALAEIIKIGLDDSILHIEVDRQI